jgi:hypothetical protein
LSLVVARYGLLASAGNDDTQSFLTGDHFTSMELRVRVVEARNLPSMDAVGKSDPYC